MDNRPTVEDRPVEVENGSVAPGGLGTAGLVHPNEFVYIQKLHILQTTFILEVNLDVFTGFL